MKRLMKFFLWLVVIVLVLATGLVALLMFKGGSMIKAGVEQFGPQVLGVPVTLKDVELDVFRGHARLVELHVGNPEGFQTPGLFDVGDVQIDLDPMTIVRGTIHVKRIFIDSPQFTYEKGNGPSNLAKLQEKLGIKKKKPKGDGSDTNAPGEVTQRPATNPPVAKTSILVRDERKIIIDELTITNAMVNASVAMLQGSVIPVELGPIEVLDVGKTEGGVTISEAMHTIVRQVTAGIEKNVDAVTGGIKESTKGIVDTFKSIFGKKKKDKKKPGE